MINFENGVHSSSDFVKGFLTPLFTKGIVTEVPNASYYAICYGELCAYNSDRKLISIWSTEVPDCECDVRPGSVTQYAGTWRNV